MFTSVFINTGVYKSCHARCNHQAPPVLCPPADKRWQDVSVGMRLGPLPMKMVSWAPLWHGWKKKPRFFRKSFLGFFRLCANTTGPKIPTQKEHPIYTPFLNRAPDQITLITKTVSAKYRTTCGPLACIISFKA